VENLNSRNPFFQSRVVFLPIYFSTMTGVPIGVVAKKILAILSGRRIHPWESGTPGKKPVCIPTPGANCMNQGMEEPWK
jgi:hypothetical protein